MKRRRRKAARAHRRLSKGLVVHGRGRRRLLPPAVMSCRAAPSWMPLTTATGVCVVRRRIRPVAERRPTAMATRAPAARVWGCVAWVAIAAAAWEGRG